MKCINFDKEFRFYLQQWMKTGRKKYRSMDEMEAAMPEVYRQFLDTPADFLAGEKPGEYFDKWDDPKLLVDWMADYFKQRVPVPDILLNRISALGLKSENALMNLLLKERMPREAKMCAMSLLREIDSLLPMDLYIGMQLSREEDDEAADKAVEGLATMGARAYDAMRTAFPRANDHGREALLSLMCDAPCDDELFSMAMGLFEAHPEKSAVLADYISRLGDERALPALRARAASDETGYLDYIELRSAIEKLGGDAPERDFDETDPAYEALRALDRTGRTSAEKEGDPS